MPNIIELNKRDTKGTIASRLLRSKSLVPGVIYGDQIKSRKFSIAGNQIAKLLKEKGTSSLFDVKVGGEENPVKVIIQDIQRDPVTDQFSHIDLYQVRTDKKLHTEVPLEFIGESQAVKDFGGTLTKQISNLPIECLPDNLIHCLEVPIDSLRGFGDVIRVSDLNLPKGVETNLEPEFIVASVIEPRSEEELAELEEEVKADVEGVEVEGEKKEKGEEGDEPVEEAPAEDKESSEEKKEEKKE